VGTKECTRVVGRHVVRADMHAVGPSGQRHVDAVVDHEWNAERNERGLDRARPLDHAARFARLVAQLHERRPTLRAEARKFDQVAPARALRIDNGVQAQIEQLGHGLVPALSHDEEVCML